MNAATRTVVAVQSQTKPIKQLNKLDRFIVLIQFKTQSIVVLIKIRKMLPV